MYGNIMGTKTCTASNRWSLLSPPGLNGKRSIQYPKPRERNLRGQYNDSSFLLWWRHSAGPDRSL